MEPIKYVLYSCLMLVTADTELYNKPADQAEHVNKNSREFWLELKIKISLSHLTLNTHWISSSTPAELV
jgi:hypothetical protein